MNAFPERSLSTAPKEGSMKLKKHVLVVGLVLVAATLEPTALQAQPFGGERSATAAAATTAQATGSLQLRAELQLVSIRAGACPPGVRETVLCPSRTGTGLAPGLGTASVTYSYLVDEAHPACSAGGVRVLGYPVRLAVAGKGELQIAVAERAECIVGDPAISAEQSFTITGGTGLYAGASGGGTVSRALGPTDAGAVGTETWAGTLTVPGLEFDTTAPTLSGAAAKTVRAKKGARNARVVFAVTAQDGEDGAIAAACTPRSGSRFKVGRTRVSCSATDSSGNRAAASFTVTVKRAR
jgi:hypothetical protein